MFRVDEVEKSQSFEPIPDGIYSVAIVEAQHVNDEKGARFEFTYVIPEAPYKNRKLWAKHMYIGTHATNPKALETQKGLLADLFFVCGIKGFDTEQQAEDLCAELVGVELKVRVHNSDYQGKPYANVNDYWKPNGENRSGKKLPNSTAQVTTKPVAAKAAATKQAEEDLPF